MPEKVDLLERVEGHVGIELEIKPQSKLRINFGIKEGPRLFEKFLEGRTFKEVPLFVQRICGFCPIVHNLSAVKALENVLGITPSPNLVKLRRALHNMEFIQSHSAHLYLLTLPDFKDHQGDIFSLHRILPETVKKAVELRKNINSMIETLGGRAVHQLSSRIGGFSRIPSKKEIQRGIKKLEQMKPIAEDTIDLFAELDYPDLEIDTHYLAIGRKDDRYPLYDGHIVTSRGKTFKVPQYSEIIQEKTVPYSNAKFSYIDRSPYLVGALSRINLHKEKLHRSAKRKLEDINIEFPSDNPYHNNVAQAIEMLHCIEKTKQIYNDIVEKDLNELELSKAELKEDTKTEVQSGSSADAVEAPRGTLFHSYGVDGEGIIQDVDILTPTAQSAANIEDHINVMVSKLGDISLEETRKKIKKLVRTYDPCISCSVH